jgi:hypothetical protein
MWGGTHSLDAVRLRETDGLMPRRLLVESERLGEAVVAVQVGAGGPQESGDAIYLAERKQLRGSIADN